MSSTPLYIPPTPRMAAAQWIALRRSGQMTGEDMRGLEDWLQQDPSHREAFERLEAVWNAAGELREDPVILAAREWALKSQDRPSRMRLFAALAACLAVAVIGGWGAMGSGLLGENGLFAAPQVQEMRTGVGQTATVTLMDGSVVTLDTDTVLRAHTSGRKRLVELERGQAFFRVAKDPGRPFIVSAGGRSVTATGTAFEVRHDENLFEVTLVEGKVAVEAPSGQTWRGQSADMRAGWRLTERDGKPWDLAQIDVNKETSWLSGRLVFFNDPLGQAVDEVNRYSGKKIVVDPAIAGTPIVGVFKIGDVEAFVRAARMTRIARVARDTDQVVELTAP
jgi:transmembrane sensor